MTDWKENVEHKEKAHETNVLQKIDSPRRRE
jgi:hypothetical protein